MCKGRGWGERQEKRERKASEGEKGLTKKKMKTGEKDGEGGETGTAPAHPTPIPHPPIFLSVKATRHIYTEFTLLFYIAGENSPPAPGASRDPGGPVKVVSIREHFPDGTPPPAGRDALVASPALIGGGSLPGPG